MKKIRRQSPIKGGRKYLSPAVLQEIEAEVSRLAARYNVSRSWIVATVLADAFHIEKQERYYKTDETKIRRVK
jgi:predicted transcriptional regulator